MTILNEREVLPLDSERAVSIDPPISLSPEFVDLEDCTLNSSSPEESTENYGKKVQIIGPFRTFTAPVNFELCWQANAPLEYLKGFTTGENDVIRQRGSSLHSSSISRPTPLISNLLRPTAFSYDEEQNHNSNDKEHIYIESTTFFRRSCNQKRIYHWPYEIEQTSERSRRNGAKYKVQNPQTPARQYDQQLIHNMSKLNSTVSEDSVNGFRVKLINAARQNAQRFTKSIYASRIGE